VEAFHSSGFELLEWQGDKHINGISPLSSQRPDLLYRHSGKTQVSFFFVECKYRHRLGKGFALKKNQFEHYESSFQKTHIPVYILIGVGGEPNKPTDLYIVPLNDLPDNLFMCDKQLLFYRRDSTLQPFRWWPANRLLQ
jgi:hypothetical protein